MARRKKLKDEQPAAPQPVTSEIFDQHASECSALKQAADDANSKYREGLKRAKTAGLNEAMLRQALSLRKQDPDKITNNFRDLNTYLKWLRVPVGAQLGLFGEMSIATAIENEDLPKQNGAGGVEAAYVAGVAAGKAGRSRSPCPYTLGTEDAAAWDRGWEVGQTELAMQMGDGAKTRMKRRKSRESRANA